MYIVIIYIICIYRYIMIYIRIIYVCVCICVICVCVCVCVFAHTVFLPEISLSQSGKVLLALMAMQFWASFILVRFQSFNLWSQDAERKLSGLPLSSSFDTRGTNSWEIHPSSRIPPQEKNAFTSTSAAKMGSHGNTQSKLWQRDTKSGGKKWKEMVCQANQQVQRRNPICVLITLE